MRFSKSSAAALAIAALPFAAAQTSTSCNPTEKKCPKDTGLNKKTFSANFLQGQSAFKSFTAADGTTPTYGNQGMEFTINQAGQAPTIQTDFYVFFGRVDVKMRASPGAGIVSSVVFLSDDLDEIDWEWLGGNGTQVETNFFGKGNTTTYDRAEYYPVSDPQDNFHTYSVDWNSDRIEWIIDGKTVRTVPYGSPLALGGKNYPQTPMRLKLGSWCGGCSGESEGTVQWAGGPTTFNDAPYVMYVESIAITNYNPADAYVYHGESGSWQSIHIEKGGSTTKAKTSKKSARSVGNSTAAAFGTGTAAHIKPTGSSHKGGNSTVHGGGLKTSVVLSTTHLGGSGPTPAVATVAPSGAAAGSGSDGSSGSASPGLSSSSAAQSYSIMASTSLLAVLFGFMLL